jgi:hypothetical protein
MNGNCLLEVDGRNEFKVNFGVRGVTRLLKQ